MMKSSRYLWCFLAIILALLSPSPSAFGEGPSSLAGMTSLDQAREQLFKMRDRGSLPGGQREMMDLARDPDLEQKLRGKPLGDLMEGVSYKETGSPPAKSRGLMSDIDRTVSSLTDFEKIKQRALDLGYKLDETDFRIKIEGLDTVIWKPGGKSSALTDPRTSLAERARILASDPEFALEAGRKAGAHSFMSVAENLIKGQEALLDDLSGLPAWKAELKIVDGAKDVLRSLQAANMCTGEMKSVCTELEAIRKMDKPPGGSLLQKQKELRGLMGDAFQKSQILLDMEMDSLLRRMQDAVDPDEIAHLQGRVAEMRAQMTEGVERFRMLEEKFPNEMRQVSGGKSAAQIRDDMVRRGVKLEEGRSKLAANNAADDRAKERAKKVEKISYVVDALQFVECLHQEGKDVTACLKEAAQGLVFAEGLAKGTYVISLVSETGGMVVSGTLTVAGLGATIYFTGAKLGEAAYEASEYWEARQREKAALAGMDESQRARVQSLAQQLEKLEAQVNRFVTDIEGRKKLVLADLDKYEKLSEIMKEATVYRDRHQQRLATLQAALAKAAPSCNEIQGTGESLKRSLEQTRAAAQQVEDLLRGAQKSARECGGQEALDKGNGSYQEAEKLVRQNREAMKSLEIDRRNLGKARDDFQAALREAGGEAELDRAREILGTLESYAAEAEANRVDIGGISDRVAAIESDIEAKKSGFKVEVKNFKYAFPENLTREWVEKYGFPEEMATAWLRRLEALEAKVAALEPMGDADWREKRAELMAGNPALGAEAKLFIQEVRQRGPRLKGMADAVEACLSGSDGMAAATDKLAEDIDTERSLSDLAFDKLGREYLDLRTACTRKLGGTPSAPLAGPPPDKSKKEVLFILQEGYPKVNPENADLKNIVVDASGLTVELRERWDRVECDQKVRFTYGRPPSILKPEEIIEVTFLGKAAGEDEKLCTSYSMDINFNVAYYRQVDGNESSSKVGLVATPAKGGFRTRVPVRDSKYIFRQANPGGRDNKLDIDLTLYADFRLSNGESSLVAVRYRYEPKELAPEEARRLLASRALGAPPAPPEGTAGPPAGSRPETLAADPLLLEMLTGDVTIYFDSPQEAQPLTSAGQIKPGATVQAGRGSQAAFKTPGGASVRVGENSKVKMAGPEPAGQKQVFELEAGTVEVNRKQDLPGFDDVIVRSGDSQAWATQTRYRVRVTERGTTYEVLEGTIHITGQMLAKTDANFQVPGKYSFPKEMDLHAGEKAIAFKVGSGQPAATTPPPTPSPSALPAWATGGNQTAAPADALSRPEPPPWNDPQVQALMDEWLRTATPTVAAERPGHWRFSEWGQVLGPGSIATGAPDHPAGWSRHQSLWPLRDKFNSLNLCTMGQYIERRLKGEGLEGCAKPGGAEPAPPKGMPSWLSQAGAPPAQAAASGAGQPLVNRGEDAVSRARQQVADQEREELRRKEEKALAAEQESMAREQLAAAERRRIEEQRLAEERRRAEAERRRAEAEAERARQEAQDDFTGEWRCTIEEGTSGRTSPANIAIVHDGFSYVLVMHTDAGDDRSQPAVANGNRLVFVREFSRITATLTLRLDGGRLTGTNHIDRDNGTANDYPITCVR